jgi:hypothetical protein
LIATDGGCVLRVHIQGDLDDAERAGRVLDEQLDELAAKALPSQPGLTNEDTRDSAGSTVAVYPTKLDVADGAAGLTLSDCKREARTFGRRTS